MKLTKGLNLSAYIQGGDIFEMKKHILTISVLLLLTIGVLTSVSMAKEEIPSETDAGSQTSANAEADFGRLTPEEQEYYRDFYGIDDSIPIETTRDLIDYIVTYESESMIDVVVWEK